MIEFEFLQLLLKNLDLSFFLVGNKFFAFDFFWIDFWFNVRFRTRIAVYAMNNPEIKDTPFSLSRQAKKTKKTHPHESTPDSQKGRHRGWREGERDYEVL